MIYWLAIALGVLLWLPDNPLTFILGSVAVLSGLGGLLKGGDHV